MCLSSSIALTSVSVVDQLPLRDFHLSHSPFFSACSSVYTQPSYDVPSYSSSSDSAWCSVYSPPCHDVSTSRRTWSEDDQPPSHYIPLYSSPSCCTWSEYYQPPSHEVLLYLYSSGSTWSRDD